MFCKVMMFRCCFEATNGTLTDKIDGENEIFENAQKGRILTFLAVFGDFVGKNRK